MKIESNYRSDEALRASFNELAGKIFGLNFEDWYQHGFWQDNYNPYSVIEDGKVVANISVNACNMNYKGKVVRLIQLGTIMTDPDYRGKGYSRVLMERILEDYRDKVDGIYLFANDSVLDFYPKFGFRVRKEYQYSKPVTYERDCTARLVPMSEQKDWDKMTQILNNTEQNSGMYMVSNSGLYMFYLSQFMQENTFHIEECDSCVIAEVEDDTLILHAILGKAEPDQVIAAFGRDIRQVILAFTPRNTDGFEKNELIEEDTTLFVQGKFFDETENEDFMFQTITHA